MNKKGFTLIELLAVIIILGVLMIIAIPSVTTYIQNSRKNAYIDTAKEIVSGARNLVNEGKLKMFDKAATYYIPEKCISTENGSQSPFGEFKTAYVGVVYQGDGYNYYWVSVDSSGQGIKKVTAADKLNIDDIESNLDYLEVEQNTFNTGIGGRKTVLVLDDSCKNWSTETENATTNIPEGNSEIYKISYPDNKDPDSVTVGDIVTIEGEQFYIISNTSEKLVLLAKYNLNVGPSKNPNVPEGKQHESVRGAVGGGVTTYGTIAFSSTPYWSGKVGEGMQYPGEYCNYQTGTNCVYVCDENSYIYQYLQDYKAVLNMPRIKIRLLTVQEADSLGCIRCTDTSNPNCTGSCQGAPSWLYGTRFWLGNPINFQAPWVISSGGSYGASNTYSRDYLYGVRPVIEITK